MSGGRIEIDPEGLRLFATKMRGAGVMLSETGRALTARSSPVMPPHVLALVTEVVIRANAELQDLALELETEAQALVARATLAEVGGGDVAWLLPGLYGFRSAPGEPLAPDAVVAPATDEETMGAERWAIEMLDGMADPTGGSAQEAARLETGDAPDDALLEFADVYQDSTRTPPGLISAADIGSEAYQHHAAAPDGAGLAGALGGGAVGGALGAALTDPTRGAAALGLSAGMIAGTGGDLGQEPG